MEFECLGISVGYFGTHSIRKGAATFLGTGCTLSSHMASVFLHANWTLERVKDRYIKLKKTGYQFVGSAVIGLPILKKEFAISPP